MEKLLNDDITAQIKAAFAELIHPVQILFFTSKENDAHNAEALQLLTEVSAVDEKISLSAHDITAEATLATQYNVDKAPVILIAAKDGEQTQDLGIQFSGIPSGYEFSSLISDIIRASKRDSGLGAATRDFLKTLTQPLLLQVFVTPT